MSRDILQKKILEMINELNELTGNDTGTFFISGDASDMTLSVCIKGNISILSNAICHQLDYNPEFNRILMSILGAYLSGNPEQKKIFLNGLQLADFNLGVN